MPGDIVLVHDVSVLKKAYKMAVVETVKQSADGLVRSCIVSYRVSNPKDSSENYSGGKLVKISHSVQRLTLLLSVEEQEQNLVIENGKVKAITED